MKSILHLKFIALYLIFAFLCIFTTATLTTQLITDRLEEDTSQTLYREASLIASDYLPSYFTDDSSFQAVQSQLAAMRLYLESSLWFVKSDGTMITSSNLEGTSAPEVIRDFDPAEIGGNQYITGNYHGYFDEDMITVMSPVTQGFSTKGYLLIHSPVSLIDEKCRILMVPVLITLGVIYLLSFIFLIGFHFFVYRPLRQITEAAKQYASGNLDYEIPVYTHDEIGYLSASLNYMAVQLKDMDDYQKKIVANVSHDFRSPLTSIKGYVEAMNDGTIPPELHEKYLRIILFETERLTDLTTDLLTLNEFDTKELLLDKTQFDIQEVIKTTAESFEGVCTPKHISIELLLLPGEILVYADRRKIQQVLYNLIDNAIKFSENNSSITIEVVEKNGKVFVSVKDHGIGIPKKELNKIWERFYKSDLSRGKDKKGTGLGLSIVKEVIQAHDEHINVISTEGVGTEFIFSLSRS
ncbi:MAG TPA: HAMP domain-containing protein [Candidatus Mediterraneibacter stercoravium]|uniref:histidine kinase n=1 Tax=Candidatus Mediterraneibacter stercoravium TaxID=2838685 RepID=A0A9D2G7Y5_9FIRM|nr:HAMP domain-containing protein [Candidatus Mediterraneibacter stercoravium]